MGVQIANVWHFDLPLYLIAFNPALGELYKKRSVCTRIRLVKIQNRKNFLGRGTAPSPDPSPWWGGVPTPLGAEVDHRAKALKLGVPRVMFLGNDP